MSRAGANMFIASIDSEFVGTGKPLCIAHCFDIKHVLIKAHLDFASDRASAFPGSEAGKIVPALGRLL